MNDILINPNKTACLTGHRILQKDFDKKRLYLRLEELLKDGYDTFLVGMAIGFDTEGFKVLLDLKNKYDLKIIACIPCLDQSKRFNKNQKEEYDTLLTKADEKILISTEYTPTCMQKRNKFMVDYSSVVVSYLRHERGGTTNTVAYAIKTGRRIIHV